VEDIPSGTTVTYTTTQLREQVGTEDVDVFLQKRQLRFHPDYVNPVLQRALNSLLRDKLNLHPSTQLLVRALSCEHAKHICHQINSYGYGLSCDWIGTKSEYNGRPDEENKQVIRRFCPPKDASGVRPNPCLDVLVQVGMAGEGFDSIMVSQLADLSLVAMRGNANQTKQFILRGARWIYGGDPKYQVCQLSVGTDHPILDIPGRDVMEWLDSSVDFRAKPKRETQVTPEPNELDNTPIDPDWTKGYANLKEVKLLTVSKDDPFISYAFERMGRESGKPNWSWGSQDAVSLFTKYFDDWQRHLAEQQRMLNEVGRQDHLRRQINTLVKRITSQLIERCSKQWDDFQSVTKCVYKKLKEVTGNYISDCSSDQLQCSWDFLVNVHNEIIKGNIPPWVE
jgi:hypothetical protein